MRFEFICDDGVFYSPALDFLVYMTGNYTNFVRADFKALFPKLNLAPLLNLGTNKLFFSVDEILAQSIKKLNKEQEKKFNEFAEICKKQIVKDETPKDFFYDHSGLLSRVDRDLNKLYKRVMDIEKFITEIDFKNIISYDKEKKIKIKNLENQIKAITEHLGGKYENGAILLCKEKLEQKETKKRFFSNFF